MLRQIPHPKRSGRWVHKRRDIVERAILLVDSVEFRELSIGRGKCAGGVVHETLDDRSSKILGSGFDVLVGDRLGLGLLNLDIVDAQWLPKFWSQSL